MEKTSTAASEPREAATATLEASHQTRIALARQVAKGDSNQVGKESKMVNAKNMSTAQSGENEEIVIAPKKVEKLEADEYLLEKALKAQESAWEEMRRKHWAHVLMEKNRKHNKNVRRRKTERQNRKGGRK